ARFGQTFGTVTVLGFNDEDFGDIDQLRPILDNEPTVSAIDDAYSAVAELGDKRTTLYSYDGAGGPRIEMVLIEGRPPESADEIVLGPAVVDGLGASVGDTVEVIGTKATERLTLVGIGFTPEGPHNAYANAGWVTRHGYDALFDGFKFHFMLVAFAPEADTDAAVSRLNQATTDAGFGPLFEDPFTPQQVADIGQVKVLPVFLGGFLALLAVGAVGHALATAVRRRRHDIAVLRALGMTRWQSRGVVVVQASVLALVGLVLGVPLGIALGRILWQVVADYTPLQYVPPLALLALVLVVPGALIVANLLAAWPGRRAAGLRIGHVLRTE
ncbi:MAG: FtsX-like permease family protein, partial [Geodermatophilaceae bacterium]